VSLGAQEVQEPCPEKNEKCLNHDTKRLELGKNGTNNRDGGNDEIKQGRRTQL